MGNSRIIEAANIWMELMKFRLSVVVTFSAATGYFLFRSNADPDFYLMVCGVFFLASGASVLNQISESEEDYKMIRTRNRPVPSGRISPGSAEILFLYLFFLGTGLILVTGIIPCILGVACVILYNFVYTPMKKYSALAIFPGALTGAIPPLIGFIAAGGTWADTAIKWFMFFMFTWQLPHFWILLMRYGKEYQSAGFKTLIPFISESRIRWLTFSGILLSLCFLTWLFVLKGRTGNYSVITIFTLNIAFLSFFVRLFFLKRGAVYLRKSFILLNSYALVIMIILIVSSLFSGWINQ